MNYSDVTPISHLDFSEILRKTVKYPSFLFGLKESKVFCNKQQIFPDEYVN